MTSCKQWFKWFRVSLVLAAVALVSSACSGGQQATPLAAPTPSEPYVFGVSADLVGPFAEIGKSHVAGIQAYAHRVNKAGGINGHPIKLIVLDSRGESATSVSNFKQMVDQKALGVSLASPSTLVATTGPLADELKVPIIAAGAADNLLYPTPRPYFFRWLSTTKQASSTQVAYFQRLAKASGISAPKVAVVAFETTAAQFFTEAAAEAVQKAGWAVPSIHLYPPTATDLTPVAVTVAAAKPDYIVSMMTDAQVVMLVEALRQRGSNAAVANIVGTSDATLKKLNDEKFAIVREYVNPADTQIPAVKEMMKEAEEAGVARDMPNYAGTAGYVMGMVVEAAARKCGWPCDGTKFRDALESGGKLDAKNLAGSDVSVGTQDHVYPNYLGIFRWDDKKGEPVRIDDWIPLK